MQITPEIKKIILTVVIVAAAAGVIITAVAVTRSILSKANETESATPPSVTKLAPPAAPAKTASPSAAPTPIANKPKPAPAPSAPVITTTSTGWTTVGAPDVDITPSFSSDLKNLYLDFGGAGINYVTGMDYTLSYVVYPGIFRVVKGSLSSPYTRKVIPIGTCSGLTCVYDSNTSNYSLKVLIKSNNGLTVNLKTLTFSGIAAATDSATLNL